MTDQNTELEAAKRKIRAMAERTIERGFTEEEVIVAMRKVGQLLEAFNLTLDEVMLREEPVVTKQFVTESKHRNINFLTMVPVAQFCQTKCYFVRPTRWMKQPGIILNFFGLEPDVDMAIYLCQIIQAAGQTGIAEFKQTTAYRISAKRRRQTFSFYNGMAGRLNERLNQMKRERDEAEKKAAAYHAEQMKDRALPMSDEAAVKAANATTGTALMRIAKEKMLDEKFNLKLKFKPYKTKSYASAGISAGRVAGDKVNLARPLAHKGYGSTLLLR